MTPKKVLADLKVREAELAAQYTGKRKRAEDLTDRGAELQWLKKGPRDQTGTLTVETPANSVLDKPVPDDIPLSDVRSKGLLVGGPSCAVESVWGRI